MTYDQTVAKLRLDFHAAEDRLRKLEIANPKTKNFREALEAA